MSKRRKRISVYHLSDNNEEGKLVLCYRRKNGRGYLRSAGVACGPDREQIYVFPWARYPMPPHDHPTFRFLGYL